MSFDDITRDVLIF